MLSSHCLSQHRDFLKNGKLTGTGPQREGKMISTDVRTYFPLYYSSYLSCHMSIIPYGSGLLPGSWYLSTFCCYSLRTVRSRHTMSSGHLLSWPVSALEHILLAIHQVGSPLVFISPGPQRLHSTCTPFPNSPQGLGHFISSYSHVPSI